MLADINDISSRRMNLALWQHARHNIKWGIVLFINPVSNFLFINVAVSQNGTVKYFHQVLFSSSASLRAISSWNLNVISGILTGSSSLGIFKFIEWLPRPPSNCLGGRDYLI